MYIHPPATSRKPAFTRTGLLCTAFLAASLSAQAQNFGFGTNNPKSRVSVHGNLGVGTGYGEVFAAPFNGAIIEGFTGIGTPFPLTRLHLEGGRVPYDNTLLIRSNSPTPNRIDTMPSIGLRVNDNRKLLYGDFFGEINFQQLSPSFPNTYTGMRGLHRGFDTNGDPKTALYFATNNGAKGLAPGMMLSENGFVGIGTGNLDAPLAPLHVFTTSGWANRGTDIMTNYRHYGVDAPVSGNGPIGGVSIYANGSIVSGSNVHGVLFQAAQSFTASDERIKNVAGLSDASKDLDTLKQLRITDYTMKDKTLLGDRSFKKVIAQEVEAVFPQAVSKATKSIPDVLQAAKAEEAAGGRLKLVFAKASGLKAGDEVEVFNKDRSPETVKVESVEGDAIVVALKAVRAGEEAFVYGRMVKDFGVVDYEALSMLNISATQELSRKVAALEAENAELRQVAAEVKELKLLVSGLNKAKADGTVTVSIAK